MFSFHKFQKKILMHWMTYQNQAKISKKWSNKNICRVIGNLYKIYSPTECRNNICGVSLTYKKLMRLCFSLGIENVKEVS